MKYLWLLVFLIPVSTFAVDREVDSGGTKMKDGYLSSVTGETDYNFGGDTLIKAGLPASLQYYRGLIYTTDNIVAADTLVSCSLYIYLKTAASGGNDSLRIFRLKTDFKSYVGTANGATALNSNDWNHRRHTTIAWATAGCNGANDVSSEQIGIAPMTGSPGWLAIELDSAVMDSVARDVVTNNGILLRGSNAYDGSYGTFYSTDVADASKRPYIVYNYLPPTPLKVPRGIHDQAGGAVLNSPQGGSKRSGP